MKGKIKIVFLFIIIFGGIFVFSLSTLAHPGRTAADGCHYCRTNCSSWGVAWNQRHCHRAKLLPQPESPIKSHLGDPEGYTEPAPEYEAPLPKNESPVSKYNLSSPKQYTAEVVKEDNEGSIWWWVIGIGIITYLFYIFKKNKQTYERKN